MKTETILETGSGECNEDFLVLQNNLFGVFDGATSLDDRRFAGGKTGGLIASETAGSIFAKNHYPLTQLAMDANRAIRERMICNGVDCTRKEDLWSTSAAVVRIKRNTLEWVQTGDSFILLIYQDGSFKVLVEKEDHDFDTLCLWKKEAKKRSAPPDRASAPSGTTGTKKRTPGASAGNGWERIVLSEALRNQIRKTRAGMNLRYGVLNGEEQAGRFLHHGCESLHGIRDILLFTDGMSIPKQDPNRTKEFKALVDGYLAVGLTGLRDRIRAMEKADPQCIRYPRFKCHDDIAAIAITDL